VKTKTTGRNGPAWLDQDRRLPARNRLRLALRRHGGRGQRCLARGRAVVSLAFCGAGRRQCQRRGQRKTKIQRRVSLRHNYPHPSLMVVHNLLRLGLHNLICSTSLDYAVGEHPLSGHMPLEVHSQELGQRHRVILCISEL
jgi:hypothetical protein